MHYLDYRETLRHVTGDFPMAYYAVDENFPRYRMVAHWHREGEIIRVRRGLLHLYLDEEEVLMEPGDVLAISGGVIHSGEPEGCMYECIVFDAQQLVPGIGSCQQALKRLQRNNVLRKNGSIEADPALRAAAESLFALAAGDICAHALESLGALIGFLVRQLAEGEGARLLDVSERAWQKAEQIKPALEYIEQHYAAHITLGELAGLAGFSPKYFCRYFRAIVHRSPIDYLNSYRVECAAHLLTDEDLNVAEVAARCGFADSSAFIKQFRRYKGDTPRRYKVRMSEGAAGYGNSSNTLASSAYAAQGYINVACGNRGKQDSCTDTDGNPLYTGDAPCCLVDQKNAARFVK